jgi:hypothetical protein
VPTLRQSTAGVVGVSVARRLLLTHAAISYAVIVSTEIFIVGWYNGKDEGKLILNYYYWSGAARGKREEEMDKYYEQRGKELHSRWHSILPDERGHNDFLPVRAFQEVV